MRSSQLRNGGAFKSKAARLSNLPRPVRPKPKPICVLPPSPESFARHLVIMVEDPAAGRQKSQLSQDIGAVRAAAYYRSAARTMFERLASDKRWQTTLAIAPDSAVPSPVWPAYSTRMTQGGGDISHRIQRVVDHMPRGPVVIVGTDVPTLQPRDVWPAFRALGDADAVFGPGRDGGYWLVGVKRRPHVPKSFKNVPWSKLKNPADKLRGLKIKEIAPRAAVSDGKNLARLKHAIGRRIVPLAP